jgi:hypothetical protein
MRRTAAGFAFCFLCAWLLAQDQIITLPGIRAVVEIEGLGSANIRSIALEDLTIDDRGGPNAARSGRAMLTDFSDQADSLKQWLLDAQNGHKVVRGISVRLFQGDSKFDRGWNLLQCTPIRWTPNEQGQGGSLLVSVGAVEFVDCGERYSPVPPTAVDVKPLPQEEEDVPTNFPFGPEGFEESPYGNVITPGQAWGVGPNGLTGQCAGIGFGAYPKNAQDILALPSMDLSQAKNPVLSFWHRYEIEHLYDSGKIAVYDYQTQQYEYPDPVGGYPEQNLVYSTPTQGFYTGSQGNWVLQQFDLSKFAGREQVGIVFLFVSDDSIEHEGWFIDDVQVAEASGGEESGGGTGTGTGTGSSGRTYHLSAKHSRDLSSLNRFGFEIDGSPKGQVVGHEVILQDSRGESYRDTWDSLRVHHAPGEKSIDELQLEGALKRQRKELDCWIQQAEEGRRPELTICIVEILKDGSEGRKYCFPVKLLLTRYQFPRLSAEGTGNLREEVSLKPERLDTK